MSAARPMARPPAAAAPAGRRSDPALTVAVAARVLERGLDEMTLPQFRILSLVAVAPERAGRIASAAAVSRPSLTGILDGLVARGWVERVQVDGDRRGVRLEITAAGRRALAEADTAANDRLAAVLAGVSPDEQARVADGLDVLGRALQQHLVRDRGGRA